MNLFTMQVSRKFYIFGLSCLFFMNLVIFLKESYFNNLITSDKLVGRLIVKMFLSLFRVDTYDDKYSTDSGYVDSVKIEVGAVPETKVAVLGLPGKVRYTRIKTKHHDAKGIYRNKAKHTGLIRNLSNTNYQLFGTV